MLSASTAVVEEDTQPITEVTLVSELREEVTDIVVAAPAPLTLAQQLARARRIIAELDGVHVVAAPPRKASFAGPAAYIHFQDEVDLRKFFGELQAKFERSSFGGMVDRMILFSMKLHPAMEPVYGSVRGEPGHIIAYRSAVDRFENKGAQGSRSNGYTPQLEDLEVFGRASRVHRLMSVTAQGLFELYYGNLGTRWMTGWGSAGPLDSRGRPKMPSDPVYALCHLTRAGREWMALDRARAKEKGEPILDISEPEHMYNLIARAITKPTDMRRERLAACDRQARAAFAEACAEWREMKAQHRLGKQSLRLVAA